MERLIFIQEERNFAIFYEVVSGDFEGVI